MTDSIDTHFKTVRSNEKFSEFYYKPNGLHVVLIPHDSPTNTISCTMNFHVGSYDERVSYTGSAHLLEHLLFKNPLQGDDKQNIFQKLDKYGAVINATTSDDRTNFYSIIPYQIFPVWAKAEAARMRYIPFDIDNRDRKEKEVVVDELRMGNDNVFKILTSNVMGVAFDRSGYNHMTSGYIADVRETTEERLKEFWTHFYGPNNCSLVVVGPMNPKFILSHIHNNFNDIPSRTVKRMNRDEVEQLGPRHTYVFSDKPFTLAQLAFRGMEGMHPDSIVLDLIAELMQFPKIGILQILKENHVIPTFNVRNNRNLRRHLFQVTAAMASPEMVKVLQVTLRKWLDNLSTDRIDDSILNLAKTNLKNRWNEMYSGGVEAIGSAATEAIAMGNVGDIFTRHEQLDKVTMKDINRVAHYVFQPARQTTGVLCPKPGAIVKRPDPYAPAYEKSLTQMDCIDADLAVGIQNVLDIGAKKDPPVTKRYKTATMAVQTLHISNAPQKVFMLTTQAYSKNNSLGDIVCSIIKHGVEKAPMEDSHSAVFSGSQVSSFHNFMIEKNMAFDIYPKKGALHLKIAFDKQHSTGECLTRLAQAIKSIPKLSENDLKMKVKMVAGQWSGQEQDINASAHAILTQGLFDKNDVNFVQTFQEKVQLLNTITQDELTNFLEQLFDKDKPLMVTAVTDEDTKELNTALTEFHKVFVGEEKPALKFLSPQKSASKAFKSEVIKKHENGRADGVVMMAFRMPVTRTDKEFTALRIGCSVLGDGIYSRLNLPLRVQQGLSYGVYSRLRGGHHGSDCYMHVFGSFKTDHLEMAHEKVAAIVDEFRMKGITEEEFEEKKMHLSNSIRVRMDNVTNAYVMRHQNFLNSMNWTVNHVLKNIKETTLADVNAAIEKHLKGKPSLTVIAGLPK